VLHFAPEKLIQAKLRVLPNLEYVSADLTSPLADRTVDITDIPFPDNTFDIIFCSHVLHYIVDDRQAMRELYRVLRPGGWTLLLVPFRPDRDTDEDPSAPPEERAVRFGAEEHLRSYGKDYLDRLRSAGFEIETEVIGDRFEPSIVRYFGLYADETWIVGRKL
jgi:ubiquinone/menaquinone biosynthesis C-methylase UbiE